MLIRAGLCRTVVHVAVVVRRVRLFLNLDILHPLDDDLSGERIKMATFGLSESGIPSVEISVANTRKAQDRICKTLHPENCHTKFFSSLAHRCIQSGQGQSFPRSKIDIRRIVSRKSITHRRRRSITNHS